MSSVSEQHCDVIAAIDGSKLPVVVLLISRMAGKENLDHDLGDFQPPKKKAKTTRESGARFKCHTSDEEIAVLSKGFVPANTR